MTSTIETLASYLGRDASLLLADAPFKSWILEKSLETDLEKPRGDYVFAHDGMDFICDDKDKVRTIFLYSDKTRCFKERLQDLPLTSTRQEVLAHLGSPVKSSHPISDPILGEYGMWDRFTRSGSVIHVEYHADSDTIKKITLMRSDLAP